MGPSQRGLDEGTGPGGARAGQGGLRPGQERALLAGPGAHEGLGVVLGQGFHPHRPQQMFVGLSPPRSSPAPAPAGNSSVLRKKRRRGRGANPGGAVLEEAALPLGPAVPPGCGACPRFFGGFGEPPGQEGSAPTTLLPPGSAVAVVIFQTWRFSFPFSSFFYPFPAQTCTESRGFLYFSVAAFVRRKTPKDFPPPGAPGLKEKGGGTAPIAQIIYVFNRILVPNPPSHDPAASCPPPAPSLPHFSTERVRGRGQAGAGTKWQE